VQDGYAAFKAGEGFYRQIPSNWFLAPPSYEKDQGPILEALRELGAFVEEYPKSPHNQRAKDLLRDTVRRLTDHELYVAKFYLDRNHPQAAVNRLEGMVHDYPGAQREPEVLMLLGKTYLKMKKPGEARVTFEKITTGYPSDFRAEKARLYIEYIDKQFGPKQ
jgi:outer membrane protein assembly factor BamD